MRIATAGVRTGFAMTGFLQGVWCKSGRRAGGSPPYGGLQRCGRRADVGIGPYGWILDVAI
ncbi:hypothetical protein MM35RIKEN_02310 [Vescimonas fastidiosa]|uniref:Uncharacterized protein n=1 Tax=Vescimonas fastidiosa TaxID=2714353 RepID=A0A810PM50_9FIRM|nr:hypothetical protein MM35RIKEN_02310 [Vescimonas fastidiosa]